MISLTELERMVVAKSQEVEAVKTDYAKLKDLMGSFEKRLEGLVGGVVAQPVVTEETKKPLRQHLQAVLANANEALTVKEVEELVLESGYKTSSKKNFRNIIQQLLYNDKAFKRVTRPKTRPSRYVLAEEQKLKNTPEKGVFLFTL